MKHVPTNPPVHFRTQQWEKYSSPQLTANCIAAIRCLSDTMSIWFENHQPQRTQISTVGDAPSIQNSNQMASTVDRNRKFCERILATSAIFKATSRLSAHKAALMTKTDLSFPAFSLRFVDFTVQFCFRCKFSFHKRPFESSLTVVWFLWTNNKSLLHIATNEIALFCVDNRLRQMALFVFAKVGKGRLSSNRERFWN